MTKVFYVICTDSDLEYMWAGPSYGFTASPQDAVRYVSGPVARHALKLVKQKLKTAKQKNNMGLGEDEVLVLRTLTTEEQSRVDEYDAEIERIMRDSASYSRSSYAIDQYYQGVRSKIRNLEGL